MRRFQSSLVLFFFGGMCAFAQPKIQIQDVQDWGNVISKTSPSEPLQLTAKVPIKNIGTEKLVITSVKPGCGCTSAPLEKDTLKPGEETAINVTLNVSPIQHDVTKGISITSNDPQTPQKYLTLKAVVEHPITLSTNFLSMTNVEVGTESEGRITLTNNTGKEITITEIVASNNFSILNSTPITLKNLTSFDITAKYKTERSGPFISIVSVKTDHSDFPQFTINAYGQATGEAPKPPAEVQHQPMTTEQKTVPAKTTSNGKTNKKK